MVEFKYEVVERIAVLSESSKAGQRLNSSAGTTGSPSTISVSGPRRKQVGKGSHSPTRRSPFSRRPSTRGPLKSIRGHSRDQHLSFYHRIRGRVQCRRQDRKPRRYVERWTASPPAVPGSIIEDRWLVKQYSADSAAVGQVSGVTMTGEAETVMLSAIPREAVMSKVRICPRRVRRRSVWPV